MSTPTTPENTENTENTKNTANPVEPTATAGGCSCPDGRCDCGTTCQCAPGTCRCEEHAEQRGETTSAPAPTGAEQEDHGHAHGGGGCGCGGGGCGGGRQEQAGGQGGCGCGGGGCGGGSAEPIMDLRALPAPLRAGALLGVVATLMPGAGVTVVSPEDVSPLIGQIEAEWPGQFAVRVLEEGPDLWATVLSRVA